MSEIRYAVEPDLAAVDFRDVLIRSTLGERRPVDDLDRLDKMLRQADIVVTARRDGRLVGVARSLTDFSFCCYLSDLCVDAAVQRQGIGRALIDRTQAEAGAQCLLVLLAAPAAVGYYPHIGMRSHASAWTRERQG
ncbi:GNAT family N-acetyltransferase [Telmatospirillum siberiense]|uniref:GNAT family N-acetyltransferase n=1 Tax=Telmatospirillum siberiense TaxID=382514 RepID=A0A2N3Q1B0_9PROT|nr:GNAT family N-acetyltransferase [Telmatospirillum siberiense]PKU26448.1 GNAT family N-acetyltransferase [Telmatospirillum siberiense]